MTQAISGTTLLVFALVVIAMMIPQTSQLTPSNISVPQVAVQPKPAIIPISNGDALPFPQPLPQPKPAPPIPGWVNDGKVRVGVSGDHHDNHSLTDPTALAVYSSLKMQFFNRPPEDPNPNVRTVRCLVMLVVENGQWYFERAIVWVFTNTNPTSGVARGLIAVYDNKGPVTCYGNKSCQTLFNKPNGTGSWATDMREISCNDPRFPGPPPAIAQ